MPYPKRERYPYDDKTHGTAEKISLPYDKNVYALTEANEKVASAINERMAQRKKLQEEIETMKKQFEKPIDTAYFGL